MKNTQHKKRLRLKGFDYIGQFRYSLTFCTKDRTAYFDDAAAISGVAGFLRETSEKHGFRIWSFCFMPDHLHVLVEGERPSSDLRKFVSLFKQKSGYWFRRHYSKNGGHGFSSANKASLKACPTENDKDDVGQDHSIASNLTEDLWQINYYEHVLRSEEATEKVARYIIDNPVRKGLVPGFCDYPFSWCDVLGFVGQGFSPANHATLKACPPSNPEGLPYKSLIGGTPHSNGFTLIEIVITIVLVSILSGLAAMIILQGVRAYSDEQSRSDVHYQARLAVERIAREARLIRSCGDIVAPANLSATLSFTDISGNPIAFNVAGVTLSRGANVLANNITSPTPFRFLDNAGNGTTACPGIWFVEIAITDTQGSESLQMRTRVHPRNF